MKNLNKLWWLILLVTVYGVLTFATSQATSLLNHTGLGDSYLLLIGGLLSILWGVFYFLRLKKETLYSYLTFKDKKNLLVLLLTFFVFTLTNITIDRPLALLTPTYDISIVPTNTSEETTVKISSMKVDNQSIDLSLLSTDEGWTYKETLDAPLNTEAPLMLNDLTNELITINFVKTTGVSDVSIYRDTQLIKTIDLDSTSEYKLQFKASPDFILLLAPAYLGIFSTLYLLLQTIIHLFILPSKKIQSFMALVQAKLPFDYSKLSNRHLIYSSLPFILMAGFKWIGLANLTLRPLLILVFLLSMIIIEIISYKKSFTLTEATSFKIGRAIFYLIHTSITTVIVMQLIYFIPHVDLSFMWIARHVNLIFLTATVILSISVLLFTLFNNYILGLSLSIIFMIVAGFSNYYKMLVVGEPIYASDLSMLSNMDDIIGYVQEILSPTLVITLIVITVLLVLTSFFFAKSYKLGRKPRLIIFSLAALYLVGMFNYSKNILNPLVSSTVNFVLWNQLSNYEQNGFIFGFITNMQNDLMTKDEHYSKENLEFISTYYQDKATAYNETLSDIETPNIMVIVSESLSDPTVFDQLTFSEDPLPNLRHNMTKHSSGTFLSPFKGNRTANVEFEFLLSFSNSLLLEGTVPFQQTLSSMQTAPSMLSYLKNFGYSTVGIHPNNAAFYKRSQVYPVIGFDKFLSIDEMTHTDLIASQKYVTDEAVFNEMLDELYKSDAPAFVYGLTMQNHIAIYEDKFGPTTITVTDATGERDIEMENYAEGLKQTDEALQNFITTIENYEEPTTVIFFGDHLVNFSSDIHAQHGFIERNPDAKSAKLFFETPLLMMSNVDGFEINDLKDVSPVFLAPLLFEELNLPLTPFYMFLLDVYHELNVLHNDFILDSNQEQVITPSTVQQGLLTMYELIQYDFLEGEQYISDEFFTLKK